MSQVGVRLIGTFKNYIRYHLYIWAFKRHVVLEHYLLHSGSVHVTAYHNGLGDRKFSSELTLHTYFNYIIPRMAQ